MAAGLVVLNASSATAGSDKTVHKSYVCKYVGTPGVDERLQTGQNPIWVDNHSLTGSPDVTYVGEEFSDAHGRSVVIVANTAKLDPEPSVAACPAVKPSPSSSTSPSHSPSSSPSGSPSQSPSYSPSTSPSVSPSESVSPSTSPSVSPSESVSPSGSVSPSQPASTSPSVAGTETVKPRPSHHPVSQPTVLGTQAVAPTAVEAGLSTWPPQRPGSPTGTFVGAGLLGGGLLLLVSGGWLGLGGRKRGAHQA